MKLQKSNKIKAALLASVFSFVPTVSQGAGFAIIEQSVSSLGNAFAGMASNPEDASTVYFNPAGMMELSGSPLTFGVHYIKPSIKFQDKGSTIKTGGNGGDAGGGAVVPNVYFVTPISEQVKFGIGINAPFGLTTEYDSEWVGRYQATKSELISLNINPAIAFNISESWSFGFGANFSYVDATLQNALDFGAICGGAAQNPQSGITQQDCATNGLLPQWALPAAAQSTANDGSSSITGDSWAMGWNAGVLFAPTEFAKVGFSYRSKIKHKLGGNADFTIAPTVPNDPTFRAINFAFADSEATANLTLPESYTFSGYSKVAKQWALLGDITYTKWSRFQELTIEYQNPFKSSTTEENRWRNTYRYSIGVNFLPSERWVVRAGFAYDEGAATSAEYRSPRVPDQDRKWLALGFGYKQQNLTFDIGYAHLFIDDADINRVGSQQDTLTGTYELAVDILSAQFNYIF